MHIDSVFENYLVQTHSTLEFKRYQILRGHSVALVLFGLFCAYLWAGLIIRLVSKQTKPDVYFVACTALAILMTVWVGFLYIQSGRWAMIRKVWNTASCCRKSRKEFLSFFGRDPSTMQPWLVHMHLIRMGNEARELGDSSVDDITYIPKGHFRLAYECASHFFSLHSYEKIMELMDRQRRGENISGRL
jgi:hypothetical protein